jgi:PAS domain S-box-containing protein
MKMEAPDTDLLLKFASELIAVTDFTGVLDRFLQAIGRRCTADWAGVFLHSDGEYAWELSGIWSRNSQSQTTIPSRVESPTVLEHELSQNGSMLFRLFEDTLETEGLLFVLRGSDHIDADWNDADMNFLRHASEILGRALEQNRRTDEFRVLFDDVQSQLEKWHRAEEEKILLVTAVDQAVDMIIMTDDSGKILYVNPSFEVSTGYKHMEVFGRHLSLLESNSKPTRSIAKMMETILTGREWSGTLSLTCKDGSGLEAEASISPIRNENGEITNFVSVQHDVSREIELRHQLEEARKLESIGALAGGIAHDFNNLLTPIIGYSELTMEYVEDNHLALQNLQRILKTANRAKALVKQILTFSLQGTHPIAPIYIQPVIREAVSLLKVSTSDSIQVRLEIEEDCGMVFGETTQMHQVLMNLLKNAVDAMEGEKGVLTISLAEVFLTEKDMVRLKVNLPPNRYVRISVRDTGKGMDPAIKERIFEPYFSTKEPGKGTGMGLSVLYGIVIGYGGDIRIESEPGIGSEFSIYLPRVEGAEQLQTDSTAKKANIMYVDDDELIADLVRNMLEGLGYYATIEITGEGALATFKGDPDSYDCIITDYTMPGMNGRSLAEEIHRIRSDIPVLLCSGFSEAYTDQEETQGEFHGIIVKPIAVDALAESIEKALSGG